MARQRIIWSLEVTQHLNELLERYLAVDAYKTKSEFIRAAVRDRLDRELSKLQRPTDQPKELEVAANP